MLYPDLGAPAQEGHWATSSRGHQDGQGAGAQGIQGEAKTAEPFQLNFRCFFFRCLNARHFIFIEMTNIIFQFYCCEWNLLRHIMRLHVSRLFDTVFWKIGGNNLNALHQ